MLATLGAGCTEMLPPLGQAIVFLDTDAPLAFAPGSRLALDEPAPLFDALMVDVLGRDGAAACGTCARSFAIDREMLREHRISFAIVPDGAQAVRVRMRMFRRERLADGEPPPDSTVDLTFEVPPLPAEGIRELTAFLPVARLAKRSLEPERMNEGAPPARDTLGAAEARGCRNAPIVPGMVCVPGGAFWEGNALAGIGADGADLRERVKLVKPFYLDATEVDVATYRASGHATPAAPRRSTGIRGDCTYSEAPGANERLPVTCVDWQAAASFCEARGGRLPTSAELEMAGGGLRSSPYVWGNDRPSCDDAVFSRTLALAGEPALPGVLAACLGAGVGAAPAGSGARDRLVLPGGTIVDLAGNVSEWTLDRPDADAAARCSAPGLVASGPCSAATVSPATPAIVYGGDFYFPQTKAIFHRSAPVAATPRHTGFRCARDRS